MRPLLLSFALISVAASGCSSSDSPSSSSAPPAGFVEIGPEGGELVDNGTGGFPGFALKIPPGALATKVRVSFAGVLDATPLPEGAERVGPQVRVLPTGTTLAKPAQLTFPMDPELRAQFENAPSECKVWTREGDGWKRLEPVSTTDDSVTVEVSTFQSAAAAGVILRVSGSTCPKCLAAAPLQVIEPACADPSGYCITEVPPPAAPNALASFAAQAMTVDGTKLYYVLSTNDQLTPVSYDLFDAHETKRFPSVSSANLAATATLSRIAVAANGDVWQSIGGVGNVRFPAAGGLVQILDTPGAENGGLTRPEGVQVRDGEVVRFVSNMSFATFIRSFLARNETSSGQMFLGTFSEQIAVLPAPKLTSSKLLLRSSRQGIGQVAASPSFACGFGNQVASLPSYGVFTAQTVGDRIFTAVAVPASVGTTTRLVDGLRPTNVPLPNAASDMVIGSDSKLYAVNTGRPEIMVFDHASPDAVSVLPLTTLPSTDPGYTAMLPKRIFQIGTKPELLVVTQGNATGAKRLFRIRRAP